MTSAPGPLVSVVIPAYNAARTLGDAVDSVSCQTYRPVFDLLLRLTLAGCRGAWVTRSLGTYRRTMGVAESRIDKAAVAVELERIAKAKS